MHHTLPLRNHNDMKFLITATILALCSSMAIGQIAPKAHQLKWHEAEIGVLISYDLHVFDNAEYNQAKNRITPIENYNIFNPTKLDVEQWILAAKAGGAKFAVLTATHETGFALYQSDVNPFCLKALKWKDGKGDIVRDFVDACRKHDIQPGIYLGIRWGSIFGIHNFKAEGESAFATNRQKWYKKMCEDMTREICSRYGDLFMIWYDGGADDPKGYGPDVLPIVQTLQPNALFYHNNQYADFRWAGSETGTVGYPCWSTYPTRYSHGNFTPSTKGFTDTLKHGDKNGAYWVPAMSDVPLRGANGRHDWFWEPKGERGLFSVSALVDLYYKSVGRNSTLILGITPNDEGLMPESDVKRLAEFGSAIQSMFGSPIAATKTMRLKLKKKQAVNHVIIQEQIAQGERIRKYTIQAQLNGKWVDIAKGESVGHKRIEQFPTIQTSELRLVIKESIAPPIISNFSAHYVNRAE